MSTTRPRPVSAIEPGWQVRVGDEWFTVWSTAYTVRANEPERMWLLVKDQAGFIADPIPCELDDQIMSRPPEVG